MNTNVSSNESFKYTGLIKVHRIHFLTFQSYSQDAVNQRTEITIVKRNKTLMTSNCLQITTQKSKDCETCQINMNTNVSSNESFKYTGLIKVHRIHFLTFHANYE
jgi:hypothetical protein